MTPGSADQAGGAAMQGERDGVGSGSSGSTRVAGLVLVIVAALPLLAARLASLPLLDPDEAKHAQIAREMLYLFSRVASGQR